MRRHTAALFAVFVAVASIIGGCGPSQEPTTTSAVAPPTTASVQTTASTRAPTTTTMATTTTTVAQTTTTMATTTTTEPVTTTTSEQLVRVPSYTDFDSSYEGDDFGAALEAWQTAVEAGFRRAGLVADIELVPPGDEEFQRPKAGEMVPKGTVVHIQVAVYD